MFALFFAFAFWLWAGFVTVAAGFFGAVLNCEYGCSQEPVEWAKPWTLGRHYVYPEVFVIGLIGFVHATLVVMFVRRRRPLPVAVSLVVSLLLLSYPYFAGLTSEGRRHFWFGPLLGAAALAISLVQGRERGVDT